MSETFLILRRNERDMIKNVYWYSCPTLMKLEFSRHIFEKSSNIQFHENPSSGSRVVLCGPKDRRTDMTKLIVVFRNFANAPKTGAYTHVSRGVRTLDLCLHRSNTLRFSGRDHFHRPLSFLCSKYSPYVSSSQTASIIFFP